MISEEFVGDDGFALLVPQHRNGDAAGIFKIGFRIDLVEIIGAVECVAGRAILLQESPAVLTHEMMDDGYGDHVFQLLQFAKDQRPVRPGASQRDVEMIAAGLRLETVTAAWAGRAVSRHPVAELRGRALELAAGAFGIIPPVLPFAVDQQPHRHVLSVCFPCRAKWLQRETNPSERSVLTTETIACGKFAWTLARNSASGLVR